MEFKSRTATFSDKSRFRDTLQQFVSEEAAIFNPEKEEAASASMDRTAEKVIRFSADKDKVKAKQKKMESEQYHENPKTPASETISQSQDKGHLSKRNSREEKAVGDSKSGMGKFTDSATKSETATVSRKTKTENAKSSKKTSKETKKAAAKTAVANFLKGKADASNDLVSDKVSGDALADGNRGLVKTFTTVINPMTYIKKWLGKLAMVVAPYILMFMSIAAVLLVVISLVVSIAKPLAEVGEALNSVMEFFTGDGGGLRNTAFTDDEIEQIVNDSGATDTQKKVIRFALSKVSYTYSQDARTSGSAYDCSSLAYYSWQNAGTDISYGSGYPPTAAEGARMLNADSKSVNAASLQPGDLIYYGGSDNGRYMGIYHVAIYVGNGMAVEALNEKYGVVYQKLRTKNACMVCRPNV